MLLKCGERERVCVCVCVYSCLVILNLSSVPCLGHPRFFSQCWHCQSGYLFLTQNKICSVNSTAWFIFELCKWILAVSQWKKIRCGWPGAHIMGKSVTPILNLWYTDLVCPHPCHRMTSTFITHILTHSSRDDVMWHGHGRIHPSVVIMSCK